MAAVAEHLEVSPTLEEARELDRRPQPGPRPPHLHRGLRDAGQRVPEAARRRPGVPARVRRAGPAGRPLVVHRLAPARVVRWSLADGGDPYTLAQRGGVPSTARRAIAGLPPFAGGAVGFFGFDCVRAVERLPEPNPDVIGLPDMALMLSDVIVAFDHLRTRSRSSPTPTSTTTAALDAAHARAVEAIRQVRTRLAGPAAAARPRTAARGAACSSPTCRASSSRAMVARIIEYIHAGDAYQVVPSQRWSAPTPVEPFSHLPRPARRQPVAVHVLPRLRGLPDRRRLARAAADRQRPPRLHAPDRRHPPARRGRRRDRRRAAGRREGARRARDARRPRPQRPRPRVRARHRARRAADGGRDLLARDPHRLPGRRHAARGRGRDRRAAQRPARRHALRRAEDPRDGDHRRARAGQARRLRRRGRLAVLRRRARHLHLHPHRRGQGRRGAHPGRRRHGRRRQARTTSTRSRAPRRAAS